MSDTSSSPSKMVVPFGSDNDNTVVSLRQVIYSLRHQVGNLKTDNALLQQTNKSITDKYEAVIQSKNDQISKLSADVEYLYQDREAVKSLGSNTKQIGEKKSDELQRQIETLQKENKHLQDQLDEVDESVYKLNSKYQKAKSDLDYTVEVNEQLEDRLSNLEDDNNQLLKYNDELIKKLEDFTRSAKTNDMSQFNESLHLKNISLQKTNNQLQLKLDKLLQNKTSTELLKQKNASLMLKCKELESLKEKYAKLEIEKIELETKYSQFVKFFEGSSESLSEASMSKFISSYTNLKNVNLILEEKYNACKSEMNQYKSNLMELEYHVNHELQPELENLKAASLAKDETIEKLNKQISLGKQEVEFLRSSLVKMERINSQNQKEAVQKSTDEYLSNLERLVDEYKKEISSLQAQLQKNSSIPDTGSKRPRIDDVYRRRSEMENSSIQAENTKLQAHVKELENQVKILQSQIDNFTTINIKKKELHTLQLKSNPFAKDQIVKQATLDALRAENESLIDKFIKSKDTVDVPRAVFERQEVDKANLVSKLDDLVKRNIRFKESFNKKARDILLNISKFFGFTIEFSEGSVNPSDVGTKIKLTSKYRDAPELKNAYLILDLPTKSLKAYGNNEFKNFCGELMNEWANSKDQVSCILSALNIKLYQKYVLKV